MIRKLKRKYYARRIRKAINLRNRIKSYKRPNDLTGLTSGMTAYMGRKTGKVWLEFTHTITNHEMQRMLNR